MCFFLYRNLLQLQYGTSERERCSAFLAAGYLRWAERNEEEMEERICVNIYCMSLRLQVAN